METEGMRLIDWDAVERLEARIAQLPDEEERAARMRRLMDVLDSAAALDGHILRYEHRQRCRALEARGLRFVPLSQRGTAAQWSRLFAASVPEREKRRVHFRQYKWHLFSYGVLPALEGEAARQAFLRCAGERLLLFFQCGETAYRVENAALLRPADLEADCPMEFADAYLFDPKGRWTYVQTHEAELGPYFYTLQ